MRWPETAYKKSRGEDWGQNSTEYLSVRDKQKNSISGRRMRRDGKSKQGKARRAAVNRGREFHDMVCLLLTNHTKYHAWNRAKKIFFEFSNYETTVDLGERKGSQKWADVMSQQVPFTWWGRERSPAPVSNFLLSEMWTWVSSPRHKLTETIWDTLFEPVWKTPSAIEVYPRGHGRGLVFRK